MIIAYVLSAVCIFSLGMSMVTLDLFMFSLMMTSCALFDDLIKKLSQIDLINTNKKNYQILIKEKIIEIIKFHIKVLK